MCALSVSSNVLRVYNLSPRCSEADVRHLLRNFGEIIDVRFTHDELTFSSSLVAIVTFSPAHLIDTSVLRLQNTMFMGQVIS